MMLWLSGLNSLQHSKCSDPISCCKKHKVWIPSFQNLQPTHLLGRQCQHVHTLTHVYTGVPAHACSYTHRNDTHMCVCAKSLQSRPTLCDLMVCSLPDSSVHGILQARILEWVSVPSSRGSSQPRDRTQVYHIASWILYQLSYKGNPRILEWVAYPFSSGSS